jgi:hypothetical protein
MELTVGVAQAFEIGEECLSDLVGRPGLLSSRGGAHGGKIGETEDLKVVERFMDVTVVEAKSSSSRRSCRGIEAVMSHDSTPAPNARSAQHHQPINRPARVAAVCALD